MHNISRSAKGIRLSLINVCASVILSGVKIIAGLLGNSYALIADGVESLLDIFSSTVVWGGLKIGSLPADKNHPFGHGRAESLAAMFVSLILIFVAVGIAAQSVKEIFIPHHAPARFTLLVLIGVIIVKECLYQFMIKVGDEIGSLAIKADAWHSRSDALTSLAALIGISVALIAGKGYESADDWAALFASAIIFFNGYRMLRSAIDELMDIAVPVELEGKIKQTAKAVPGVVDIEKCRIRKSGLDFFVEVHVVVDGTIPVKDGHAIAHCVKQSLIDSGSNIVDVFTHVEPREVTPFLNN